MKIKEIRDLGINELNQKNSEILEELFRLKIRHGSAPFQSPAMLGRLRKDIARIKTVLKEKEAVV